ncbi:MAG: hypothetical protein A2X13_12875 [Bacteroidetes bacterium GWC2_33_15]|nr:MAG: hypothetical protein A2X10_13820 [Bacteroidetes bacterium GWA2_33_15]OFX50711.1 MAG: hypothetical protein A2X13_12875 [Bacteroidetes bacterium GWC2_33_15]OFX63275.1 MAG: hypothetical protein A2X15_01925 [Bacteroidetes bacterium GWB2_32_14]OFX69860.1 MAG: hypothetical protein A2X14_05550 [Bacteroidetes bacterium GWD2_33_33]
MRFHSSVIFVKDISISKSFYCDILKQEILYDFGNNVSLKGGLSLWQIQNNHIISKKLEDAGNPNKSLEIYFETDNIFETASLINDNKIKLFHNIHEETWGQKTIRFFDPDYNLIEIGEKLEIFIQRMYKEGLPISEINKKTGVPENLINEYIK